MDDLNVIDQFMQAFVAYIDSGFGLLGGDVGFLTTILIGIDITLAGLFWALGGEDDVIAKFLKKILYVGVFALILNSFQTLSEIIFRSFAGLGLTAGGSAIGPEDLLMPGRLAGTGFEAAWPLLRQAKELVGPIAFFDNFIEIAVLVIAWLIVIAAFFILAIQLFITILEFKLTSLAGFVLVPFALWNRTSFLAERVLGNVVSSGIKVMVLAVIVGIGSNYFADFTQCAHRRGGQYRAGGLAHAREPCALRACDLRPRDRVGTGVGRAAARRRLGGRHHRTSPPAALPWAEPARSRRCGVSAEQGSARSALEPRWGAPPPPPTSSDQETSGSSGVGAGSRRSCDRRERRGREPLRDPPPGWARRPIAVARRRGTPEPPAARAARRPRCSTADNAAPAWAQRLQGQQTARHRRQMAMHTIKEGDRGGAGIAPDINERD